MANASQKETKMKMKIKKGDTVVMITADIRRCTRVMLRYVAVTALGIADNASSCKRRVALWEYASP